MIEVKAKVVKGQVGAKTPFREGTKVRVQVVHDKMADLASEIGAKAAVQDALAETGLKITDPQALKALEAFAKAVGKGSLMERIPAQEAVVGAGGMVTVAAGWPDGEEVTLRISPV